MIDWLEEHTDALVAAANFTSVTFLLVLSVLTIGLIKKNTFSQDSGVTIILYGVTLEAFAWALHRTYWGSWRLAREWEVAHVEQWFIENSYLALVPSALVLTGISLILTPFWGWVRNRHVPGRPDYLIPMGLIGGVFWFLFFLFDH